MGAQAPRSTRYCPSIPQHRRKRLHKRARGVVRQRADARARVLAMARPVIALDADGVLLDFHLAYAAAWQRAFGEYPQERDPQAYWPIDRWEVPRLGLFKKARFKAEFDEQFWSTVPALDGAVAGLPSPARRGLPARVRLGAGRALRGRTAATTCGSWASPSSV